MPGFVAVGQPLPQDEIEAQLRALTYQEYELATITRGTYIMEEEDLPERFRELLHGRAYIIDSEQITESDYGSAKTYYIAADKVQGLIVPARSMFIEVKNGDVKYRWTDDGDKWTNWISLETGVSDDYSPQSKNRFAEVQLYKESGTPLVYIIASR